MSNVKHIFTRSLSAINASIEDGVFENVSLITIGPAVGHGVMIDRTTLEQVLQCSKRFKNGVRVNLGHFSGMENAVGYADNLRVSGPKILGTLHLFPEHPNFALTKKQISEIGDTFGFSLFLDGPDEMVKGVPCVRCETLFSADIVPVPSANASGIFERGNRTTTTNFMNNKNHSFSTFHEACRHVLSQNTTKSETPKTDAMKRAAKQYPDLYRTYCTGQENHEGWTREALFMSEEKHQRRLAIIASGGRLI